MTYTCQYLQFGSNTERVPGYEEDLQLGNQPYAPIPIKLVNPHTDELWDLAFSYESGGLYPANSKVPGFENATIQSWYFKEGGTGPNVLAFTPFLIDAMGGSGGFIPASNFVDFSQPTSNDSSINTDTLPGASVVATVHPELSEYARLSVATHAANQSIAITNTTTHANFDRIVVYSGNSIPVGNTLTVNRGQSCYALAVFNKVTTQRTTEFGTIQYPKIPKTEWPMIISEIVAKIMLNEQGEIYEHLSARVIATLEPAALKSIVAAISQRIEQLGKIKTVITGLEKR